MRVATFSGSPRWLKVVFMRTQRRGSKLSGSKLSGKAPMSVGADIAQYNTRLLKTSRDICELLLEHIAAGLPKAEGRVWHGHPVWFLGGNPVAGYSQVKSGPVRLLFWSGQSFDEEHLTPIGKYKAAEARYTAAEEIDAKELKRWLKKSRTIQWDYENLPKNRKLVKLTEF